MMEEAIRSEVVVSESVKEEEGEDNSLLFVSRVTTKTEVYAAIATILVAPDEAGDGRLDGWVVSETPFAIKWSPYFPYTIGGRKHPSGFERVRNIVEGSREIRLRCSQPLPPAPFYISGNPSRKPSVNEVILRISFDSVDFLPAIQIADATRAWSAHQLVEEEKERLNRERSERGWLSNWLHRLFRLDYVVEDESYYSLNILAGAQDIKPFSGLYMPVSLANIAVPCVLKLNEFRGNRTFSATLYSSDLLGHVPTPIDIVSTARWSEGDDHHVVEKVIGSIQAIT